MGKLAIFIADERKDNLFVFALAERLRAAGVPLLFHFSRKVAWDKWRARVPADELFSPPDWRNEFCSSRGLHRLLLGGRLRQLAAAGVKLIFAVQDYGLHAFWLGEGLARHGIPGAVITRCIIPKRGTWEVDPSIVKPKGWRKLRLAAREFLLRGEEAQKRVTRRRNTYFAWGGYDRERLLEQGTPPEHILVSGCPLYEGMLTPADSARIAAGRDGAERRARASTTAVVYSQPLEQPFMLGPEAGPREKLAFFRALVQAGFREFIMHLHPQESALPEAMMRAIGAPVVCHRDLDLARRLDLLQLHGWYFTFASTSILESLYAGSRGYLFQVPGLGPVDAKLPGFPVLTHATLPAVRGAEYAVARGPLMHQWIADADHSVTFLENWIKARLAAPAA